MNMSRFYIKNNMVIQHPSEINKKEEINNFAIQAAKDNSKKEDLKQYKGSFLKRQQERVEEPVEQYKEEEKKTEETDTDNVESTNESNREKQIRIKKKNANRVLHERNIYVFLASVAEDAMNYSQQLKYSEIISFLLVRKLVQQVEFLKDRLAQNQNIFQLELWDLFTKSKDFIDIFNYITKEYDIFKLYFQSLYDKISQNPKITGMHLDAETKEALSNKINIKCEKVLKKYLKEYCRELVQYILVQMQHKDHQKNNDSVKQLWIHADRILDCMKLDQIFLFEDPNGQVQFNFKQYYEEDSNLDLQQLIKKVENKFVNLK